DRWSSDRCGEPAGVHCHGRGALQAFAGEGPAAARSAMLRSLTRSPRCGAAPGTTLPDLPLVKVGTFGPEAIDRFLHTSYDQFACKGLTSRIDRHSSI